MFNIRNSWKGVGRLARDNEVNYGGANKDFAILRNSIAIDRAQSKADKDAGKVADFINIVVLGKQAETLAKYTSKGSLIIVEGELHNDNYEKDGVKHYKSEVLVNSFSFLEKAGTNNAPIGATADAEGFVNVAEGIEDELPFL